MVPVEVFIYFISIGRCVKQSNRSVEPVSEAGALKYFERQPSKRPTALQFFD